MMTSLFTTKMSMLLILLFVFIIGLMMISVKHFNTAVKTLVVEYISSSAERDGATTIKFRKQYFPPLKLNISKAGIPMVVDSKVMTSLGISDTTFVVLNAKTVGDLVFATGTSSNHFSESVDAIASVQKHMPGYIVYYYDLGLTDDQITQVKTFCNVIFRRLDFEKYPAHVSQLKTYAFKPIIVQEVLVDHPAVVWMDASVRLFNNLSSLYPKILDAGGFLYFSISCCSNFATTSPLMYNYIPTIVSKLKAFPQPEANSIYVSRSEAVYRDIVYWWVLCALDPDCISPPGSILKCRFEGQTMKRYAGCNRFDQSVLGLLTANFYGYNLSAFAVRKEKVLKIQRRVTHRYEINRCSTP